MPLSRAAAADLDCRVLEAMTPGLAYEASHIATAAGGTLGAIRQALERLAREVRIVLQSVQE